MNAAVLVVAKAPIPGYAKTRLTPPLTTRAAAGLAAAALLDTLDAVRRCRGARRVVALSGDLDDAVRRSELRCALSDFEVVEQVGSSLSERLVNAHEAVLRRGTPVLQIGMDTPQVSADLLDDALEQLVEPGVDTVLGFASDGGWWSLGVRDQASAAVLADVPMSTPSTGRLTYEALRARGDTVRLLPHLSDVDAVGDIGEVARHASCGANFKAAVRGLGEL